MTATFKVKNTGLVAGKETVQLYVRDLQSTAFRPEKELKGFVKVDLQPGEEIEVIITLSPRAFAYYDAGSKDWVVEPGDFEILVGASSRDIRLTAALHLTAGQGGPALLTKQNSPLIITSPKATASACQTLRRCWGILYRQTWNRKKVNTLSTPP